MTLLELVTATRELLDDYGGDRLSNWEANDAVCLVSNVRVVALLNQGRNEYCVRNPIPDATSEITRGTVTTAMAGVWALDARILAVTVVTDLDLNDRLPFVDVGALYGADRLWEEDTGTPEVWTDPQQDGRTLRLVPAPTADLDIGLQVLRLPLEPLAWADKADAITEIPEAHQHVLMYWAGMRALETRAEAKAVKLAQHYQQQFDRFAGPPLDPGAQVLRRRLVAAPLRTTPQRY